MVVPVFFGETGDAHFIGEHPTQSEAGIATVLLASERPNPTSTIYALSFANGDGKTRILSTAATVGGSHPAEYTIRFTTDGSVPTAKSPVYRQPVSPSPKMQAAIFVNDQLVLGANAQTNAVSTAGNSAGTVRVVKQ